MTFWKGTIFTPRKCDAAVCLCSATKLICFIFIGLYGYLICIFPSARLDKKQTGPMQFCFHRNKRGIEFTALETP